MSSLNLKHKKVRDLAWAISSPMLLETNHTDYEPLKVTDVWCQKLFTRHLEHLSALDQDPSPLLKYLATRMQSRRLGIYFESLVGYFLQHMLHATELRPNVPVRKDGITLGEFDFLFREPGRATLVHWETAVKFYLNSGNFFYGPRGKDMLHLKLEKIFTKQLQLAQKTDLGELAPEAFVKGMLFYSIQSDWLHQPASMGLSKNHERGWWCRESEIEALKSGAFAVLPKSEWLSKVTANDDVAKGELLDVGALKKFARSYFRIEQGSVMVVELKKSAFGYEENSRGFLVHDSWPFRLVP
jgi:hypothetical protein